jgi:hypothetical protein
MRKLVGREKEFEIFTDVLVSYKAAELIAVYNRRRVEKTPL